MCKYKSEMKHMVLKKDTLFLKLFFSFQRERGRIFWTFWICKCWWKVRFILEFENIVCTEKSISKYILNFFSNYYSLQLPGSGGDTGLLTTVLIGVGLLTLVNTIATVVVPMFNGSEEATPEETQRRARNIETVKGYVFQGLAKAAELYGQ